MLGDPEQGQPSERWRMGPSDEEAMLAQASTHPTSAFQVSPSRSILSRFSAATFKVSWSKTLRLPRYRALRPPFRTTREIARSTVGRFAFQTAFDAGVF